MKVKTVFARSYIRRRAVDLMTDACIIRRPLWGDDAIEFDPITRRAKNKPQPVIYEGPCRVWEQNTGGAMMLGDQEIVTTQSFLSLPFDSPVPEPEDQVQITSSDDPALVNKYVKILSIVKGGGLRASRKMSIQILDSKKEEW